MSPDLRYDLEKCETDVQGTLMRLAGDESLYAACLRMFLDDRTTCELDEAIRAGAWDDAFTAAHALKGLAANMGFIPLYHAAAELVLLIRAGKIREVDSSYNALKRCRDRLAAVIRKHDGETLEGV